MDVKGITVGRNLKGQVVIVLPGWADDGDVVVELGVDDANGVAGLIRDQVAALRPAALPELGPLVGHPIRTCADLPSVVTWSTEGPGGE